MKKIISLFSTKINSSQKKRKSFVYKSIKTFRRLDNMTKFNNKDFIAKIVETLEKVPFILDVTALYFCLKDPKTPFFIKAQIVGVLLYFISPIDAIPDTIPVLGYSDDASAVFLLIQNIADHITEEHYKQAQEFLNKLKGGKKA